MSQKPYMATHRHVPEPGYATGFAGVHLPVDISPPLGRGKGIGPRPGRKDAKCFPVYISSISPLRLHVRSKLESTKCLCFKRRFTSPVQNTAPLHGCRNLSGVAVVLRGGACGAVQIPLSALSVQFRRVLPDSLNSRLDS